MNPKLRKFLEANGLRHDATEQEAWELYDKLNGDGVEFPAVDPGQRSAAGSVPAGQGGGGDGGAGAGGDGAGAGTNANGDTDAAVARALVADAARRNDIEDRLRTVGLMDADNGDFARGMLSDPRCTVELASRKIFERLRKDNPPIGNGAHGSLQMGEDARDKFRAAALDGMLLRLNHAIEKPAPGAREFRGMRLTDIIRESLELSGVNTRGMDPRVLAGRAISPASTSDFPNLLGALVNKTLLGAYMEAPATWRPLVAVGDATDFKAKYAIKLSGSPDLMPLDENGEYVTADLSDSKESYVVTTKGRIIRLTRQMIINDDLGGFNRISLMFGQAARRRENKAVYGLITANGNMSDGYALFSSQHNNLLTGADLSSDSLTVGRTKMRRKVGMAGEIIDVTPVFLLAAPENETNAEIILRSTALPSGTFSSGVVNPHAGKLTPITDALIEDADAWWLFASPNQYPVIEVAWLMGDQQPFIDEEVDFASDSLGIKVRHDFGAGIVDHIGAVYNPGAD